MNRKMIYIIVLILILHLVIAINCNDEYSGDGDWIINTTVNCNDEIINVTGEINITIPESYEYNTSYFSTILSASFDLREYSGYIGEESALDGIPNETEYTYNWDLPNGNGLDFKIFMNESVGAVQIYSNLTLFEGILFIDVDNNINSGLIMEDIEGIDVLIAGESNFFGTEPGLWIYNESINCSFMYPECVGWFQSAMQGQLVDTTFDSLLVDNYTLYYNEINDNNTFEYIIVNQNFWTDKVVKYTMEESDMMVTKFKNSSVNSIGVGNLTLNNVTLIMGGNITVDGSLIADNSNIQLDYYSGIWSESPMANIDIQNSIINATVLPAFNTIRFDQYYNLYMENNQILGINVPLTIISGYGGGSIIDSNYITAGGTSCINTYGGEETHNIGILNNICLDSVTETINRNMEIYGYDMYIFNNTVGSMGAYGDGYKLFENNSVNSITLGSYWNETYYPVDGSILLNNIIVTGSVIDLSHNSTAFIYDNEYGEIIWIDNYNYSINYGDVINLSNNVPIHILNNNIGFDVPNGMENWNDTAEIAFYGLTGWGTNNPIILKDEEICGDCNIVFWDNILGYLAVDVTSFSNYSAQDGGNPPTETNNSKITIKEGYKLTLKEGYKLTLK